MLLIRTNGQEFNFFHLKDLNPFASLGRVTLIGNTPVVFFIILKDADAIQITAPLRCTYQVRCVARVLSTEYVSPHM